jgi:hypothetical protein
MKPRDEASPAARNSGSNPSSLVPSPSFLGAAAVLGEGGAEEQRTNRIRGGLGLALAARSRGRGGVPAASGAQMVPRLADPATRVRAVAGDGLFPFNDLLDA